MQKTTNYELNVIEQSDKILESVTALGDNATMLDTILNDKVTASLVTAINSSSTDGEVPSAKCVYDAIQSGGGGVVPVVNDIRIWTTSDGIYELPTGCTIYYDGASGVVGTSTESPAFLFINTYDALTKYWWAVPFGSRIIYGNTTETSGNYQTFYFASDYEHTSNKTSAINSSSTIYTYPNTQAVYYYGQNIQSTLQTEVDTLKAQIPTTTATGEAITITDSSNLALKDFQMLGNATQADIPTPSAPQNVNVVTGNNTIVINSGNRIGLVNGDYSVNGLSVKVKDDVITITGSPSANADVYLPLKNSLTLYTGETNTLTGLVVGDTYSTVAMRLLTTNSVSAENSFGETYKTLTNNTPKSIVATQSAGQTFLYFYIRVNSGHTYDLTIKAQLENGSAYTSYKQYQGEQTQLLSLGSIELAKIGDYQDRIYKSGDKWYVEKNIGKYTFTGSESWGITTNESYAYNMFNLSNPTDYFTNYKRTNGITNICNYFKAIENKSGSTPVFANGENICCFRYNTNDEINAFYCTNSETSANNFKTLIGTIKPTVFYALATPTTTEITDSTLLGQLEELMQKTTYKNTTNVYSIVTGTNATGTLEVRYYQDIQTLINNALNA